MIIINFENHFSGKHAPFYFLCIIINASLLGKIIYIFFL